MLPFSHLKSLPKEEMMLEDDNRKQELVRIMIQTLENFGYNQTVKTLIEESHIKFENQNLQKFREHVLKGEWTQALELLSALGLTPENTDKACFFIYEQKYIELVAAKQYNEAIHIMRNELTKYCKETERLHKLASLIICKSIDEINLKIGRSNILDESRRKLLSDIQTYCHPENMIESNRLNKLLHQSMSYQILNCKWHSTMNTTFSLLEDHNCELEPVPSKQIQVLKDHSDEVWIVKFSPDGNHIATVAKNYDMYVWDFDNENLKAKLRYKKEKIHEKEVHSLNWSHDSRKILTASSEKKIKLWDAETGEMLKSVSGHMDIVCAAVWMPGDDHFISGGIDEHIIVWNKKGEQIERIKYGRVLDLLLSPDGNTLYAVCAGSYKIGIIDIHKKKEINQIKEKDVIISATLSKDGKFLLLNTSYKNPELHLWNLQTLELVQKYAGHAQEKYMIRCSMGGIGERLIACGGEDAKIRIWHKNIATPVAVLSGHMLTVNAVGWHPKNPKVLVSCSDDYSLRVWATEDIAEKMRDHMQMEEEKSNGNDMITEENDKTLEELPHLFEDDDDNNSDQP